MAAGPRQARTQDIAAADLARLLGMQPLAIALGIEDALGERAGLPSLQPGSQSIRIFRFAIEAYPTLNRLPFGR
jgi:hypothetical protein